MKKIKIGISFLFLVLICFLMGRISFLINYVLALLLHELAHLYVAIKKGYNLKQFKISLFGVSVNLQEEIDSQDAFAINIAGPMFNLLMCVVCLALYYLFPQIYKVLNVFCISNLVLALFNLLPIYPLDGGKIFRGLIKNDRVYKIVGLTIRVVLALTFFALFALSGLTQFNWFYLLMACFFALNYQREVPTFSLFKRRKHKKIEKVCLFKISEDIKLYEVLKLIKPNHYSIFYCGGQKGKYIDEDTMLNYALKYPLTSLIKDIV